MNDPKWETIIPSGGYFDHDFFVRSAWYVTIFDSLVFYCFLISTLINLAAIFNRGVKRVDDSGIDDCDGVDEPGDYPCEIIVPLRLGSAG